MSWIKTAPARSGQVFVLVAALLSLGCRSGSSTCLGSARAAANGGAVVVRWRVVDDRSGRLFPRGQCCCGPAELAGAARAQCLGAGGGIGSDCPDAPAWLIPSVRLSLQALGASADAGAAPIADGAYSIQVDCTAAELTTEFCLPPGDYQLSLVAQVQRLYDAGQGWSALDDPATRMVVVPAAVQRTVRAGQIVNLDAVVLVVNASQRPDPIIGRGAPDGGAVIDDGGAPDAAAVRAR